MNEYERILSKKKTVPPPFMRNNQDSLNVFISYSVDDRERIDPVYNGLKRISGVRIFYADSSIVPGDIINSKIIEAIKQSDIFLVFYSQSSIKSVYVQQEIGAALAYKKNIIPILLDETKPAGMIPNNIHYLNFSDENIKDQEYAKLHQFILKAVQSKRAKRSNQDFITGLALTAGIAFLLSQSKDSIDY